MVSQMSGRLLSLSSCPLPFLTYPSPFLSYSHPLFSLCFVPGSALTLGALKKSFQSRMQRTEMSFSDQMSFKQGLSYYLVCLPSLALCSVRKHNLSIKPLVAPWLCFTKRIIQHIGKKEVLIFKRIW